MKVIIAGSRDIEDYERLLRSIKESGFWISEVVSGTAQGADQLGERYALESQIKLTKFPAKWDTYGKRAGYLRNEQMAKYADCLIALWDGQSRGTKHMIDIAEAHGLKVYYAG